VLSHHIDHYIQVKKLFKHDYDSHMISITVFTHFLYGTLNPSHELYQHENLDWGKMFPLVKGLLKDKKKYSDKLSIFSIAQMLDILKETVRRKVDALCKKKLLVYSVREGVTIGDNWELLVKKIAPKDLLSLDKAIKVISKNVGLSEFLNDIKK
jgi:hypothetical protein